MAVIRHTFKVFISLALFLAVQAQDWESLCPDTCRCRWYNNKKEAVCRRAGFTMIPSQLSNEINVLDLTDNGITTLGQYAFKSIKLINLHKLVLANNRIASIDKSAFDGLSLVFDLDLSNNQISWLHTETFSGMEKMRKLILSGNPIQRLEAYQFPPLPNLNHLIIDNCGLSYVNNLAFSSLPSLTSISLKGNNLTVLQPELFMSLRKLRSVQLQDNKWQCDCKLRNLVAWNKKEKMGEAQLACHSPQRVSGKEWKKLDSNDLACAPVVRLPQVNHVLLLGGNVTLECGATGEPLPSIEWTLDGRVLSNHSRMPLEQPDMLFFTSEDLVHRTRWLNLTITHLKPHQLDYPEVLPFNCVVRNPAELVERNITVQLQPNRPVIIDTSGNNGIYILIALVSMALLIILIIGIMIYCCWRRKKNVKAQDRSGCLVERNNILIVNPMDQSKKSEHYEKIPQVEIELTNLSHGSHTTDEIYERNARVRSPLTALEMEEFDQTNQNLLDISANTTMELPATFPDLLDNVKFPRAISPTQLSYHSVNPAMSPDYRYSFAYPNEYNSLKHPVGYNQPQPHPRPGYVTLPRRPRTSSSASSPPGLLSKYDPIYDTLGPRTTADGTSKTELNRLTPRGTHMLSPLISPSGLPKHYSPILEERSDMSHTLPRPPTYRHRQNNGVIPMRMTDPNRSISPHSNLAAIEEKPDDGSRDSTPKKKVPPKPPPKPANKRLSVASNVSETNSRISLIESDSPFVDEGSDGTEV